MKKHFLNICLGFILTLASTVSVLADSNGLPLTIQVHENGEVIVTDGFQELARVFPWVFTGKWVHHHWQGSFLFKTGSDLERTEGSCSVTVNQVPVDLDYRVKCLEKGLDVIYRLAPRENLSVSAVEVYCRFPYSDWQGCPYTFNGDEGFIPIDAWKEKNPENAWLIRQADSSSLSIGPSRYHGGLTAEMKPDNLYVLFADDRWYDPKLSIVLNHNDAPGYGSNPAPDWIWEKGQSKNFHFTLTFNRALACPPGPFPTPAKEEKPQPTATATQTPILITLPSPTPTSSPISKPKAAPTFDFSFLTPNFFTSPTPTPQYMPSALSLPFSSSPTWTPLPSFTPNALRPKHRSHPTPTTSITRLDIPPIPQKMKIETSPTPTPGSLIPPFHTPAVTTPQIALPAAFFTPTPEWLSLLDKQTIKFSDPPANIYVVFADGPGQYRAEVADQNGKVLEVIFDRKVVSQKDIWLEWDCLDGQRMPVAPGQYFVIVYKDGVILKSLSVIRISKDP